ncbi:MAG: succinylglutamate desuccinylase/aspartoacylase family protein [Steroidobacteraceae bacterium]
MRLDQLRAIPARLAEIELHDIQSALPNPTLISVAGEEGPPLFVSTLLHGNETTSFAVLQALARRFAIARPPRELLIFVGNVEAAAAGERLLGGQPDFNRIWSGGGTGFHAIAAEVTRIARNAQPYASVDIHNNTGRNPHYGCINVPQPPHLELARWFAPIAVSTRTPLTTQSMAFGQFCPALALECGLSTDTDGASHVLEYLQRVMAVRRIPPLDISASDFSLFETAGRMVIDPEVSFSFGDGATEAVFRSDLDSLNFRDLQAGEILGRCEGDALPIRLLDEYDTDLTSDYLALQGRDIVLRQPVTPGMLTRDHRAVRQDCLGYLMHPATRRKNPSRRGPMGAGTVK